jgi:hypothetical protein
MKLIHDKILLRELTVILIVKVILLFAISYYFFSDPTPPVTADTIAEKFMSDNTLGENP